MASSAPEIDTVFHFEEKKEEHEPEKKEKHGNVIFPKQFSVHEQCVVRNNTISCSIPFIIATLIELKEKTDFYYRSPKNVTEYGKIKSMIDNILVSMEKIKTEFNSLL